MINTSGFDVLDINATKAVEEAGAVMLVIEGVKEDVAREITESIKIPTIGIGAGRYTTGQVLVWSDMFGFFEEFKPKFVRKYLNGADLIRENLKKYVGLNQEAHKQRLNPHF